MKGEKMKDLLDFMPVYYVDVEKDQTVKMNKQLKKRVKRQVIENKKEENEKKESN